ncbi:hypothetical protein SAMN05444920_1093 [Nonomuraea solani]|uniref:Peptidase inhibitor family I36 n=1 Tax=Nonomuraea solani TaxID=1144553 RepID=A0A1H6ED87_9ACTN|nr:hypothetical protein [Nonomuraea solani]SEG95233.1 hypothetical protein SAMN05444920_1093 [Nonomuraea solani]
MIELRRPAIVVMVALAMMFCLASPARAGIGVGSWVSSPQPLYQCPATYCNQGQAYPGNDLANVCYTASGGHFWDLVFNRANGHTGFIPEPNLGAGSPRSSQPCSTVPHGGRVLRDQPMYQCPATHCNQGQAYVGNDIAFMCSVRAGGVTWAWAFNHGNGHEGFMNSYYDHTGGPLPTC